MSEVLQTFASMLFPYGFGAGVQVSPKEGKAKVHGSISKWQAGTPAGKSSTVMRPVSA